jgi:predicted CXXCH cytochrome family protein
MEKMKFFAPTMLALLFMLNVASVGATTEQLVEINLAEITTEQLEQWFKDRIKAHNFEDVECTFCHSNPDLKMKLQVSNNKVRDYYVDPAEYERSVHFEEGMETCIDCHDDSCMDCEEPSHNITCFDCHDEDEGAQAEARDSIASSVHAQFMKGACVDCHNPHYMKSAVDMTLSQKNAGCLGCHEDNSGKGDFALAVRHGWHPQAALHLKRLACIACHTRPDDSSESSFKHLILPSTQAAKACEECHAPNGRMLKYLIDIGEAPKTGLTTEQMLESYYFSGATRNKNLDTIGLILIVLSLAGVIGHGLVRILRRRKK